MAILVATAALGACSNGSSARGGSTPVVQGRSVALKAGCTVCHGTEGKGGVGPSWVGLAGSTVQLDDGSSVIADDAYIRESILTPSAKKVAGYSIAMPPTQLSEDEVAALVAYIESLGAVAAH